MALVNYVCKHTEAPGSEGIDGITGMHVTIDSAVDTTAALIKTRVEGIVKTVSGVGVVPSGYFDSIRLASDLDNTANNYVLFGRRQETRESIVG